MMKKINFEDSREYGNTFTETFEFADDTTDDEIQKEFEKWVWERMGDNFGWEETK